ncbi:caspase Nc-like [Tribolium castaneum]|uniref:Caspase Nc-like Protein n=1 Tax=Tribolium castaneum TaxID=7070 RepID=D6X3B3_TRICA|nr:caspase Nc-like [Tribolium castaneum]EFA10766.1 Caspase Nc-like Protein [Tribolium castaneum]|eukprot:NP_001164115.1 caspase Nc-like [Tribolium castaneum]
MLPEHESLIYKHFPDLVRDCDLERIMRSLSFKDPIISKMMDNVKIEEDRRHNNRCILFQLVKTNSSTVFLKLVETLRTLNYHELADKLEDKPPTQRYKHTTVCNKPPESHLEKLKIDVKYATKFCDTDDFCYKTRSRNRGQVLIINNMVFETERHITRRGAEVDERNLKELFEKMGFYVDLYRNLSRDEIKTVVKKFSEKEYKEAPDMAFVIIMSHGEKIENKTVIIGSDGQAVEEEWIIMQFNNQSCSLFRNKPKILIFNICRGDLVDNLVHFAQQTQSDSACTKNPEVGDDERYYSDLMICHPSVEGFQAHRDVVRGCWYIELICTTFMENSCEVDVETMMKMVERGLKKRISEKMTRQTSTFLNIAFKTCYLNPGIYEDDGHIALFEQSQAV